MTLYLLYKVLAIALVIIALGLFYKCKQELDHYASLLTVVALMVAIFTYADIKQDEYENDLIILETLKDELNGNLYLTRDLLAGQNAYREGFEMPSRRYSFDIIDRSASFFPDKEIRKYMLIAIQDMKQANRLMDLIMAIGVTSLPIEASHQEARGVISKNVDALIKNVERANQTLVLTNAALHCLYFDGPEFKPRNREFKIVGKEGEEWTFGCIETKQTYLLNISTVIPR